MKKFLNIKATPKVTVAFKTRWSSGYVYYTVIMDYRYRNNWSDKTLDKLMKFNGMSDYKVVKSSARNKEVTYIIKIKENRKDNIWKIK